MLLKIEREVCLAKYRNFPLCPYDPNSDEEVYYYPKVVNGGWYGLTSKTKREFPKVLKTEFAKFIQKCEFESLIFFGDKSTPWVTKLSARRTDYTSVVKAVKYFEENKLGKKFNGGVQVAVSELPEFIKHFYCITRSDASFHGFYFSDPSQNLLGFIHYGGEVLFQTLNSEFDRKFVKAIKKTTFKRNNK
jgi:hypothetical protein